MVLVLFLLGIVLCLSLLFFLLLYSTLRIDIKKIYLDNTKKENIHQKLEKDILVYIGLYLFGKWKIARIKIDKKRLEKFDIKQKIKKMDMQKIKQKISFNKQTLQMLKTLQIELEEFHLNINLGTIDVILTTSINFILIMIISMILPRIIRQYDSDRYQYEIKPIYTNENMVKLDFNGIIHIKMVHIMDILYLVLKKGRVNKHERASNRRAYDYSYE